MPALIPLQKRKKADIVGQLRREGYRPFPRKPKAHVAGDVDEADADATEAEEIADTSAAGDINDYDYLLNMQLSYLTQEKVRRRRRSES